MFTSFCTQMECLGLDLIKAAFIADNTRVKSMSDNENINLPEYLANLLRIMNRSNLSKDEKLYIQKHHRLNHSSYSTMQTLAKNEMIPKNILNVKKALPCTACLFEKSYCRSWCVTKNYSYIRGDYNEASNEASVDQIVMSSLSLVP